MDFPLRNIFEGMIFTLEEVILPELTDRFSSGQASAIILLLKDLAFQLDIRDKLLAEEVGCLKNTFQEILEGLEKVKDYHENEPPLRVLKENIQSQLDQKIYEGEVYQLEKISYNFNRLLESVIINLAGAERRYNGQPLQIIKEMRRKIRKYLKKHFEIRRALTRTSDLTKLSGK